MGETFELRSSRMDACTKLCATERNVDDTFGIARRLEERQGNQVLLRLVAVPDGTFGRDRGSLHTQPDGARGGQCGQEDGHFRASCVAYTHFYMDNGSYTLLTHPLRRLPLQAMNI